MSIGRVKINMKLITTISFLTLLSVSLLLIACTSDGGANEIAVERAQATAEAAIAERNSAISERDAAISTR